MKNSDSSGQKVKPKKITWVLLSPFLLIIAICNIISAGVLWVVDRPWYHESIRQIRQKNNSSSTTKTEGNKE